MKDLFKLIVGVLAALQVESKVGSRNPDPTATDQRSSPAGTNDCNYSQEVITLEVFEDQAEDNSDFRRVVYTGKNLQLVPSRGAST